MQHCHSYGIGHSCSLGSIPGLGTSIGQGHSQKNQSALSIKTNGGSSHHVSVVNKSNQEPRGCMQVQSLASLSGLRTCIAVSCGIGRRRGSDLAWLRLWCRLAATPLIGPLAWEPPYAVGVALEKPKKKKRETS